MKPGIRIGDIAEHTLTVTDEMRARFGEVEVHALYATAAMLTHMEWAARQHILPYLETDEEGFGYHIRIDHTGPATIGDTVRITSQVRGLSHQRVISHCEAWNGDRKIGQAHIVQAVLPLARIREKIASKS